ncbi:unnamed protein product [Pylaiella littoralis]
MAPPDNHAKSIGDDDERYTTCKGLLAYAGKQRAKGQEPLCLGFKALLPPTIVITDEDVVPPPPEDTMFTFYGVGVSVYSKEMLSKNRLPLVNGFSRLTVVKEQEEGEAAPQQRRQKQIDGTKEEVMGGRRHGLAQGQRKPQQHVVDAHGVVGGARRGQQEQQQQQKQQGSAVPATLSERRSGANSSNGGEERGGGGRDQVDALLDYAVGRVKKQVEMTKQVAEELTKLTPGKLREAAVVQAKKVKEMPTLLLDTSKRMVGSGAKFVQNYIDEQERKK